MRFDAARYLTDEAAIADYLAAIAEEADGHLMREALKDVARARRMRHGRKIP